MQKPEFSRFPHPVRMAKVTEDGRPYFREYFPNMVSKEAEHWFYDSVEEFCNFLRSRYMLDDHHKLAKISICADTCYEPEKVVIGDGSAGTWVIGFCQNVPKLSIAKSED